MKSLIGVTLAALLTGCGSADADAVYVTATWSFRTAAENTPLACPAEYPFAVLGIRGLGGGSCRSGCSDVLPCGDGSGTSRRLLPGRYEVSLAIITEDGERTYATTPPEQLDLMLGDKTYARQIIVDGGVLAARWNLVDETGEPLTCDDADVARIVITTDGGALRDGLPCELGGGYSYPIAEGSYTVRVEAVAADGESRGLGEAVVDAAIRAPNGLTDLGTRDIVISRP